MVEDTTATFFVAKNTKTTVIVRMKTPKLVQHYRIQDMKSAVL